jgi:hypothetical protein
MKTLAQFTASRKYCQNLGKALFDAGYTGEHLLDDAGWLYLDSLYIIDGPNGPWTQTDRDETTGTLAEIESALYAWACREGYCDSKEEVA